MKKLIIIALAAFVVYSNVYQCPFVFDDSHSIKENVEIRDLTNFSSPGRFLKPRAVVDFTFALNYKFGKIDVFGYHLVNILIHIINGFVVYFLALAILKLLFRPPGGEAQRTESKALNSELSTQDAQLPIIALFAALIFIVHPLQTQAVTYMAQRYASLAAFFYMGSVLFYLKARVLAQSSKLMAHSSELMAHSSKLKEQGAESKALGAWRLAQSALQPSAFFALSIICGLLAFMSKQNTASLPGAIILVEYMCFGGTWREWARRLLWVSPAFALFVVFVLYSMGLFSGAGTGSMLEDVSGLSRETELVGRWSYLCTQFSVLVIYIRLLFLPINQNLDYIYPFKAGFFDGFTPLAFVFLAALVALAVWKRKRYPVITVAIFWFFITLSVESSVIPIRDALFEHRLYLPMFGFALFAAWLPFRLLPKKQVLAILICVSIVISLGTATYLRNRVWQNGLTLWADVMAKSPHNSRARNNFANNLAQMKKDFTRATAYYNRLLELNPSNQEARVNLGAALVQQKKYREAIDEFDTVLRINPLNADALYNLGVAFMRQGNAEKAIDNFSKAIRIRPQFAPAHYNLGLILVKQKKIKEAADHFSEAIRINPDRADAYHQLGLISTDRKKAQQYLFKAASLKPDNVDYQYDLGLFLMRQGGIGESLGLSIFEKVLQLAPKHSGACYNAGMILMFNKHYSEATTYFARALQINPEHAPAHYQLGLLYAQADNFDDALYHLSESCRLDPGLSAGAYYNSACVYALDKKSEQAIKYLKMAIDSGFDDWALIKTDETLAPIRKLKSYQAIIAGH